MPITALALLRIAKPQTSHRVEPLSDGVILHTPLSFSDDPADLSGALSIELGQELAAHDDPRGIFFIPSVAAPQAKSYEDVIAEVGEGGVWGPSPAQLIDEEAEVDFGELLGGMLSQLPPSLMASAQAAMSGDRNALGAMTSQLSAMLGGPDAMAGIAEQLNGMMAQQAKPSGEPMAALDQLLASFGGSEAEQSSLREMALHMQQDLLSDPAKLEQLTAQLLGEKKK